MFDQEQSLIVMFDRQLSHLTSATVTDSHMFRQQQSLTVPCMTHV